MHEPRPRLGPGPRRLLRGAATVTALAMLAVACTRVPFTQRSQFNIVPSHMLRDLGRTSYETALQDARVVPRGGDVDVLQRVGRNIAAVATEAGNTEWHFTLLDGDQANAWALPGGYIAFYEGILPALHNEAGMAFVMGHEVGHTVADHAGERMSQQLALLGGITVLDMYLTQRSALSAQQRQLILAALGLGAEVGLLLPYSRLHEREADVIGMMYMAQAGYPPDQSLAVWQRMGEMATVRPPVFLSTHPSPEDRQQNLMEWMPRAERRYRRNALPRDTTETLWPMKGAPAVSTSDKAPPPGAMHVGADAAPDLATAPD